MVKLRVIATGKLVKLKILLYNHQIGDAGAALAEAAGSYCRNNQGTRPHGQPQGISHKPRRAGPPARGGGGTPQLEDYLRD